MSEPDTSPLPPPIPRAIPPSAVRRTTSRNPAPFILLGCGGALLAALLVAGGVAGILYASSRTAQPVIDAYLAKVNAGDYSAAYAALHPRFKTVMDEEQFGRFVKGIRDVMGAYESKSMRSINVNSNNGVNTTVVRYRMTYEKGNASATFTLINGRIAQVNIDSPRLQTALQCPYCGAGLAGFPYFCPKCGRPLGEAAEAADGVSYF